MREAEYLYILQREVPDIEIKAVHSVSSQNTHRYEFFVYSPKELINNELDKKLYESDGVVPFMGDPGVFVGETLEEALLGYIEYTIMM